MFRKILSVVISGLLINAVALGQAQSRPQGNVRALDIEQVRDKVRELEARGARVEVKLQDGRKLKGRIREVSDDHFVLVGEDGSTTRVDYAQVKSVKENKRSSASKAARELAIGAGLIGGIILVTLYYVKQTK